MKTVAEIAKDIGVSKQAVWKKIKGQLSTCLQEFMTTNGNTVYISVDGENLIKQAFKKSSTIGSSTDTSTEPSTNTSNSDNETTTKFIDSLQLQIKNLTESNEKMWAELCEERKHSREQAERFAEITRNNQVLLLNEQSKTNQVLPVDESDYPQTSPNEIPTIQHKGFFSRLFGKK